MLDFNDPAYWLERAEQARDMANSFAYTGACSQMLGIAEGYVQMARLAEDMLLATKDDVSPFVSQPPKKAKVQPLHGYGRGAEHHKWRGKIDIANSYGSIRRRDDVPLPRRAALGEPA